MKTTPAGKYEGPELQRARFLRRRLAEIRRKEPGIEIWQLAERLGATTGQVKHWIIETLRKPKPRGT